MFCFIEKLNKALLIKFSDRPINLLPLIRSQLLYPS